MTPLFLSCISGQGCVCLLVLSNSKPNRLTYGPKISMGINLDNISNEFEGQGHRSISHFWKRVCVKAGGTGRTGDSNITFGFYRFGDLATSGTSCFYTYPLKMQFLEIVMGWLV